VRGSGVHHESGRQYELLKVPIKGGATLKVLDGMFTSIAESMDGHSLSRFM